VKLIVNWILSTIALLLVTKLVPGIYVSGIVSALWAALVIGFINATLGTLLKLLTLPLSVLTLGIFLLVINAFMLKVATWFAPGFRVYGFWAAFWGALIMSLIGMLLRWLVWPKRERN
jgi:putative membrane protein